MTSSRESALITLTGIFTASLIAANLLGSRLVLIGGINVSIGIFVFPFTFLTADIITELFGKSVAMRAVKTGIFLQIYVLLFVWIGLVLPTSPFRDTELAYQTMFGLTPRMVIASITAYSVSQWLDVKVFSLLRDRFSGRFLIFRANLSAWISQLIDTLIFTAIFLGGVLPFHEWIKSFAIAYFAKVIVGTFDSPVVQWGVRYFGSAAREKPLA